MDDHTPATPFLAALEAAGELVLPLEGISMGPRWAAADAVVVRSAKQREPGWGDVVLFERFGRTYAHRIIFRLGSRCFTKGDARLAWDRPLVKRCECFGVVVALIVNSERMTLPKTAFLRTAWELLRACAAWPLFVFRR